MNATPSPSLFTRLILENWKNFGKVDVDLRRRVFIVGPNASGKSNLLDVFRFLRDVVSVGGGFQQAVQKRAGVSALRSFVARQYSDIVIRVELGAEENVCQWVYELRFNQDRLRRPIIKKEYVRALGRDLVERPNEQDKEDPERLTQTSLQQVTVNKDFREVAEFLASIRYYHIVPQLVREPDRSVGHTDDPYGGDFLEQIARTPGNTQKSRLRRIRDALKVAVPQLEELELSRDAARGTPHLRGKYQHWRAQGAWQNEDQFSDGTLRLLGLLWAALDGGGPLLLEEPELSLHPEVVRYIPQMFARIERRVGRQIITSTHSNDLLKDDGIGVDEVLVLEPSNEGTSVHSAGNLREIKKLLEGGLSLAETVMPRTSPKNAYQISLFGENGFDAQ